MTAATRRAPPAPTHIRWMIRRDVPEVLAIEAASFAAPWTEDEFLAVTRNRNHIGMVAERGDAVVGFLLYAIHRRRIELLSLAVHPVCRRQGVGRALLAKVADKLHSHRRPTAAAWVRDGNLPAHLLLRAAGWRAGLVVRRHFALTGEDGYRFLLRVPPADAARWAAEQDEQYR